MLDVADARVEWNSTGNEFLVVWEGERTNNEFEIYSRRVSRTGTLPDQAKQVSNQLPENTNFDGQDAALAYSSVQGEFLVVWNGTRAFSSPYAEFEIYGQRLEFRETADYRDKLGIRRPATHHSFGDFRSAQTSTTRRMRMRMRMLTEMISPAPTTRTGWPTRRRRFR